ncbi:MAG TPA: hypothetical protein VNK43_07375 [Gemmatimonadales bacterium]|nr:hypothetical protein [Gemmatimonadales bacterium]
MRHPLALVLLGLVAASAPLAAQRRIFGGPGGGPPDPGATVDIAPLGDEFDDPASLAGWRWHHEAEGWPSHLRRAQVDTTGAGHLYLEPATSAWYADWYGPYLFKEVAGNFDVTVRLHATGLAGGLPERTWSLAGLMVREPRQAAGPAQWTPFRENWLFLTTGIGDATGRPVFETKSTVNSRSNLKLRPACAGWVELRIVRVREAFVLLSRCPGEAWTVRDRMLRRDLPQRVQVGVVAYTDWESILARFGRDPLAFDTTGMRDGAPDLGVRVDYVRFRRPPAAVDGPADLLTDYAMGDDEVLRRLGVGKEAGAGD